MANPELTKYSCLAWVIMNEFVTENQKPLDFGTHRFMIKPYNDVHPDQAVRKSAQVGWTTLAIFKSIHANSELDLNVVYTLPTRSVVNEFVFPKVNPIIDSNKVLQNMLEQDSKNLKKFRKRFLYFRGAWTERDAISTSTDILVHDELDRSDQKIINMYRSRTQASDAKWRWRFSNPSVPGFGVDLLWQHSDQQHWIVTCSHCGHKSYMNHEPDDDFYPHYLDFERAIFACGDPDCNKEISDLDRTLGEWIAKFPERVDEAAGTGIRGYWISQLMAPWVSARELIDIHNDPDTTPEYWYNFVLGLPYQNAEITVNRETILRATAPTVIKLDEVGIGVDNGVIKHYVMMTPQGVFRYGETKSWEVIEGFLSQYPNSKMVIDANPYPVIPTKLTKKYRSRVWINYYEHDKTNLATVRWDDKENYGVVKTDRTKIFDQVAGEIVRRELIYVMRPIEMETYIGHWTPMYRTIEVNTRGIQRGIWMTQENRPDHLAHATIYSRLALMKASTGFTGGLMPANSSVIRSAEMESMVVPGVINVKGEQAIQAFIDPKEVAGAIDLSNIKYKL